MREDIGLLGRLEAYSQSDYYPLHMPGHKRRLCAAAEGVLVPEDEVLTEESSACGKERCGAAEVSGSGAAETLMRAAALDITEIDGFDNLHEPEGLLKDAMERAARLYSADETFYSVNGSTAGLLTAISAAVQEGGRLIMARNCHKAVYHAVYLRRLKPVYLYPGTLCDAAGIADAITAQQVEEALLRYPDAEAVLITSPSYDGVTADVAAIAAAAHRHGIPLIVDAAHGAHFGFHPGFPANPVCQGADLTVVSLHKTMPCMTQTALLHVRGKRIDRKRLRLFEGIYQTSSPSYFLMASMDACIGMTEKKGAALWDNFFRDRENFLNGIRDLKLLRVITPDGSSPVWQKRLMDPGKLLVDTSASNWNGKQLYDALLNRYHLQPEMAAGNYVTAIMTCCDSREGWERLAKALLALDRELEPKRREELRLCPYPALEAACSISDALDSETEEVFLEDARGRVSGGWINLYPPGIPLAVPGERLDEAVIELMVGYFAQGLSLCGIQDGRLAVLK